jgi:hypothetical protein
VGEKVGKELSELSKLSICKELREPGPGPELRLKD